MEPDWEDVERRMARLSLKELKPVKAWFSGSLGGASTKRDVVSTMASQMRHWWRLDKSGAARTVNVLKELEEVERKVNIG